MSVRITISPASQFIAHAEHVARAGDGNLPQLLVHVRSEDGLLDEALQVIIVKRKESPQDGYECLLEGNSTSISGRWLLCNGYIRDGQAWLETLY